MTQETKMTQTTYAEQFNKYTPEVFNNPMFGNLTVLKDTNGDLWFIGVEVATMLGYKDPRATINRQVQVNQKRIVDSRGFVDFGSTNPFGGNPNKTLISEEGLIELINRSDLNNPIVRQFKDWVNSVMVNMRRYGISMSDQFTNTVRNCNDVNQLQSMVLAKQQALDEAQPAIHMYHQNTQNTATITAQQIADNYGWTAQKLNTILHGLGLHYPSGDGWVLYKKYKGQDLVSTVTRQTEDGVVDFTTGYTEKGRNLVDQILHSNGYKTKYEIQDETDRRIQMTNQRAMNNNNMYSNIYSNNTNYYIFASPNPDDTWRQIQSIPDPTVRLNALKAFSNHIHNQSNTNCPLLDKNGNPF